MGMVIVLFILKAIVPIILLMVAEDFYLKSSIHHLYEPSPILPFLPKAYCFVIFMNVVVSTFLLQLLGVKVGAARSKYAEKAKKDGDADAEARFSLPKMYAEGFSQYAKEFNCVQRGHQQALETYTQYVVCSLIGGITFPIATTAGGLLWNVARWKWAEGYASGDPAKRYESIVSRGIWFGLLTQIATASATACKIMGIF